MPLSPSKDPGDYQTRGRWEGRAAPGWLAWLGKGPRTPYRYTLAVGAVGLGMGGLVAAAIGWEPITGAICGGLVAQLTLDLWWRRRLKRRERR